MKRILRITITILLTVLFLALFFHRSDPGQVSALLAEMNLAWLTLAVICNLLALLFRSLRWRWILEPEKPLPWYPTFFATAVGYMLSMVLPVRAADVTRPALLARKVPGVRFTVALGTVVTERILDLISMLSLFLAFVVLVGHSLVLEPGMEAQRVLLRTATVVALSIVIVMSSFVVFVFFSGHRIRTIHEFLGRALPKRFRQGWMRFFDSFTDSLELVRHPRALAHVLVMTAGVWFSLAGQFYFVLLAFGRSLPFVSSFLVTGMAILGLIVPTPAGVGGHHKATQVALTGFFHFDVNSSVAIAVVFHLVSVGPVIVTGLLLFLRDGLRWSVVSHLGDEAEDSTLAKSPDNDI